MPHPIHIAIDLGTALEVGCGSVDTVLTERYTVQTSSGFDLWHPGAFLSFQNSRGEGGWGRGEILQGHPSTTYLGQSGIATTKIKEGCFIVSFMIV